MRLPRVIRMDKLKAKLYRFMYGRYGTDTLSKVMLWVYAAVLIIYSVLRVVFMFTLRDNTVVPTVISICYVVISVGLVFWMFFRMFSKNIAKRRRENEIFCGFFKLRRNMIRDRKTHVYRKCPKCKAVLRLPRAKGKHTVVCPRCKDRFEVRG